MTSFLDEVFSSLERASVRFIVVGGVAVVLHGHPRFTQDLDLMVDLEPSAARRAIDALLALGLRPGVPVDPHGFADAGTRREWARRGMVVFSLRDWDNPVNAVDLFVENPLDFESTWARADTMRLTAGPVRVASIPDLVTLKRAAGRAQDRSDIEHLEEIARRRQESP